MIDYDYPMPLIAATAERPKYDQDGRVSGKEHLLCWILSDRFRMISYASSESQTSIEILRQHQLPRYRPDMKSNCRLLDEYWLDGPKKYPVCELRLSSR
jgi:hypothetical protein